MDFTTIIGILIGLLSLIIGFLWEGGSINGLLVLTAALIVFGGTAGAVIVSFPWNQLKQTGKALRTAFVQETSNPQQIIEELIEMAHIARRGGVLSLEERISSHPNAFLREGLTLVVDGTDADLTKQLLEFEMDAVEQQNALYAKIFESAGGYAPTMGIIGTVMGLIHVLSTIANPAALSGAIAVAFTATLYGVSSANLIYLPIANKIKMRTEQKITEMEMMLEGILSLQAGENPRLIQKKLVSFLQREFVRENKEEEDGREETF
ncbi:MAG: flagellar motor protein MotA [Paenibacillus sp. RIFOXYA1_FULL_44_5]|nr:MAG: flagellar motor protein MotA [Paenibacillus sp. RIFOXYA1_FULL_44_5]